MTQCTECLWGYQAQGKTVVTRYNLGCCSRSAQPGSRRLVLEVEDDGGYRDRCTDHGVVPPQAGTGTDSPFGQGSQYASHAFQARLKEYGMICSMSCRGDCWDNAPTESFFNSFKNERVHGTRYETRAEAIADVFDYIGPFYNRRRRHSTLGYTSPSNS